MRGPIAPMTRDVVFAAVAIGILFLAAWSA
jgi:hypothetical protein